MDLQSILNNLPLQGPTFYKQPRGEGQKGFRFSMDITLVKGGKCQINITPSIDGATAGRPQKGINLYDYKKKVDFSLEPHECNTIASVLPALINGTYENPAAENAFKKTLQIEHYPRGGKSRILLYRPDIGGGSVPTIGITILPSKETGLEKVSYIFNQSELKIFSDFVRRCGSDLPFYCSLINGVIKSIKSSIATMNDNAPTTQTATVHSTGNPTNEYYYGEIDIDNATSNPHVDVSESSIEDYDWNFE